MDRIPESRLGKVDTHFLPLGKKKKKIKEPKRIIKMITDLEYKIPKEPLKKLKVLDMGGEKQPD